MSVTREEMITNLEKLAALFYTESEQSKMVDYSKIIETLEFAAVALRPVSREQVEKVWRGEWVIGEPDVLGVPIHCSRCGWGSDPADQRKWMEYNGHLFCGHCGAPMTDEAVQMVMERMEALKDGSETD